MNEYNPLCKEFINEMNINNRLYNDNFFNVRLYNRLYVGII